MRLRITLAVGMLLVLSSDAAAWFKHGHHQGYTITTRGYFTPQSYVPMPGYYPGAYGYPSYPQGGAPQSGIFDIFSVLDLLRRFQPQQPDSRSFSEALRPLEEKVKALESKMEAAGTSIAGFNTRLLGIEKRLTEIESKIKGVPDVGAKLTELEVRIRALEPKK